MRPSKDFSRAALLGSATLVLATLCISPALAGNPALWGELAAGDHEVGFRLLEEHDRSRSIRVTGATPEVQPRPVRIYLWYPAKAAPAARPMSFGDYAALAEADVWPSTVLAQARERLSFSRRPLSQSLSAEHLEELLAQPVRAVAEAVPGDGLFPLILIGQGLYYESPIAHAILGEYLASHGFVVATCPLVGTHSPLVSLDVTDLETQVRDLELVLSRVRALHWVSPHRLGLLGFDMGGMACLIMAMRNPDTDALVSLETSILFPDLIIPSASPHHDPKLLRAPWMHVVRTVFTEERDQTPSLFDTAVHSDRYLVTLDGGGHADFTSYAMIEGRQPVMAYWGPLHERIRQRYEAVCLYIASFFRANLSNHTASRQLLDRDPQEVVPGTTLTIAHRLPQPVLPTYSDFLNALLTGEPAGAVEMARSLHTATPDHPLLSQRTLNRLGYHLVTSWQLTDEAIEVFKLNAELYPDSVNVYDSLAEGYLLAGQNDLAAAQLRKLLELDPDNQRAKTMLEQAETDDQ
jgi:pimeloyl-ACP methyl ester carboxylesterase